MIFILNNSNITDILNNVKFNIIKSMIDEKKTPKFIIKELKNFKLHNYSLKQFKKDVATNLYKKWNEEHNAWETIQNQQLNFFSQNIEYFDQIEKPIVKKENSPLPSNEKVLKLNPNVKIPEINKLQLACTILDDNEKIEVSPNDAETLLKNMAAIESKMNEIVKAVNKIGEAINSK